MIKEPKHIDFYTSGRQLSTNDFELISQWIAGDKKKRSKKGATGLPRPEKSAARPGHSGTI